MAGGRAYAGPSGRRVKLSLGGRDYTFRSSLEARIAADLEPKTPFKYEEDPLWYVVESKYTCDFTLEKPDGSLMYIEAKGYFTPEDRRKTVAVLNAHPNIDLRFVFTNPKTKLRRGAKSSYSDWCDKHGLKWASQLVPEEWLNELQE
jgi:hypothetical protein